MGLHNTLNDVPRTGLTKEDLKKINLNLLLIMQLNSLSLNLTNEICSIYASKGEFRLQIKNFYKQIKNLIMRNTNSDVWNKFTMEQIEVIGEDADRLEDLVMSWANGNMVDWVERHLTVEED